RRVAAGRVDEVDVEVAGLPRRQRGAGLLSGAGRGDERHEAGKEDDDARPGRTRARGTTSGCLLEHGPDGRPKQPRPRQHAQRRPGGSRGGGSGRRPALSRQAQRPARASGHHGARIPRGSTFALAHHVLAHFDVPIGWGELLKRTVKETSADNGLGLAAQLAYYFFLALFPALLFMIALTSFVADPALISRVVDMLSGTAPPDVVE